ncbi:MAG: ASKHA domain-containing protein, partial [Thermodesulfobacteriota bacterium]|nr:ASKHA domain-containing protein [Thermodesulfobacteriota bacterium]
FAQPDIDNIIRSKAAMYTILETLTASVGLALSDIDTFYVAGTFGSLINPRSAITIGMLPDLPIDRFRVLGNSSLEGAALLLSSRRPVTEIAAIRNRITYLELNVNQEFMNRFSAAKFLPHTDTTLFPSVNVPASMISHQSGCL